MKDEEAEIIIEELKGKDTVKTFEIRRALNTVNSNIEEEYTNDILYHLYKGEEAPTHILEPEEYDINGNHEWQVKKNPGYYQDQLILYLRNNDFGSRELNPGHFSGNTFYID